MAPTFWISLHILTQSPQSMHLLLSLTIHKEDVSNSLFSAVLSNLTCLIPKRCANSCSLQCPFFSQVVQSLQWFESNNSNIFFLYFLSLGVLVYISIPAFGGVEHAASIPPHLFSTIHIRQAPYTESSE